PKRLRWPITYTVHQAAVMTTPRQIYFSVGPFAILPRLRTGREKIRGAGITVDGRMERPGDENASV
ncbi:hypothetical protein, partial [Klebsiella aerogenes]|uniref:hypothetical protein n=1 Tax=Klebsiella aerogenes TaxID=548 RepID=UPI0019531889